MKKWRFWTIWIIPTINIIITNVLQYIDNMYFSDGDYNWWLDFLLLIVILIFYVLHYVLALAIPILLYKCEKNFNFSLYLFAVLSILIANIVMVLNPGELLYYGVSLDNFPQYMIKPICVTLATVIIVSTLILAKQRRSTRV